MMFTNRPLEFFVDPHLKPLAIHKAAVIPIHLKATVKEKFDRDVQLGILDKVDNNGEMVVYNDCHS